MEEEIIKHLVISSVKTHNSETKKKVLDAVLSNDDLLFKWSLFTSSISYDMGNIILKNLAEMYVTIRGFAFASSCLEMYKQQQKKRTQKSKLLRKKLVTD